MLTHCDSKFLLRKAGIDYTSHRACVLDILSCQGKALTPQMILDKVRRKKSMDKVTLYRILDLLVRRKLLRRLSSVQGPLRYEIICEKHNPSHPHFICRVCGEMECLNGIDLKNVKGTIRSKLAKAFKEQEIDIKLEGLCLHCQEPSNQTRGTYE